MIIMFTCGNILVVCAIHIKRYTNDVYSVKVIAAVFYVPQHRIYFQLIISISLKRQFQLYYLKQSFTPRCRGMALCLIMMFGRLGSVTGGNLVGVLLFTHCNVIFYISAFVLLGKRKRIVNSKLISFNVFITVATGVSYVIMKKTDDAMAR